MLKKFLYTLWITIFAVLLFFSVKNGSFLAFINSMENRTFDIRQSLIANSGARNHNKDIVIVAIDDGSYEYVLDNYGEWPLRRDAYAQMVNYIESQHPKMIVFDLMFVKSMKSDIESDNALINVFKKYDNVYTSMNLDNQPEDLRIPPQLPEKLTVKPYPNVKDTIEYSNCRVILQGILDATSNIGMINVSRSDDGVLREMPLYLKYNGKYYFSYSTGTTHYIVYAVGDSPRGPFTYKGRIMEPVIGWTTHHSIIEYHGKWYLFYHDCELSGGINHRRCVKYTELHYNEDGTIQTIDPYDHKK